ncbi:hypothetical protein O6H91_22G020300 [Diphasiastrum complanatum]|uniref:Uncharacterized protein n=2 Tax=Diphasiastrum complanatum TaxID=34168 RepID=A0ACC2ADG2_DIPCM|nr:hypothetical protein O6H91_22G020300 [Diphasiastrum complanatum]
MPGLGHGGLARREGEEDDEAEVAGERLIVGLTVFTNLGTNFALVAVREHTFGQLKGILKEVHLSHFPEWGEVTICALMVEVFSRKYQIFESTLVGAIYNQAEGSLELLVSPQNVGSRAMDSCAVQTVLRADSWMYSSKEMLSEKDLVTVASSDNLNLNEEKSFLELSAFESPDLRLSLSLNKKARRKADRLSRLYIKAMDNLACEGPLVLHNEDSVIGNSFRDADPMQHRCSPSYHRIKSANFTSDAQMDCCKMHEHSVNACSTPDPGVSNANAKNSLYAKGSDADKVSVPDREVSGNERTSDHEKDLPMLKVKPEECANARRVFGTIIDYTFPKGPTAEATVGACQKNLDFDFRKHSNSTMKSLQLRDNFNFREHSDSTMKSLQLRDNLTSTPVSEYVDEQTVKSRNPENVATIQVTGSSAGVKSAVGIQVNAFNDDEEMRIMTSDCIGVGFGKQLNCKTFLRQHSFLDDININKSQLAYPEENVLNAFMLSNIQPNNCEIQSCNASDVPEAKASHSCDGDLLDHEKRSLQTFNGPCKMPQNIYNCLQFDGFKAPNPTNNCVKESILSDKSDGRTDLENSPDSVLWMQENGGWMLKLCSETKFVEASKSSRNRKRIRVQDLNLKESHSTSGCSEDTKLEKDPFLTEMEVANSAVANENPPLLKRESSNNVPRLDTQTLFGNGKTKTKSQKKQNRPAEALESACQLKEDGSNYRPRLNSQTLSYYGMKRAKSKTKQKRPTEALESTCQPKEDASTYSPLYSQTLFGNGTKKTKSEKKRKGPAEVLENTCQLKEDGCNYRPLLDTQTLFGSGTKRTKSEEKREKPADAPESTCQLKEDGRNDRPLLNSQTLFGDGMEKTKSRKKRQTPAEALESTCQLKEDGGNYRSVLDSQTPFGNGTKKTKSQKKWKRPAEELESTCQLKEDGSNYRPRLNSQTLSYYGMKRAKSKPKQKRPTEALESTCQLKEDASTYSPLYSQTLFGNGTKKTKSKKKWKGPAEVLELKEDGCNYRPLLDTQTLFGNGTKRTKSEEKREKPADAPESTCQLKEDGSNDRPLLFGDGMKKPKSQKKRKTPAEALESTCQLKEDGGNYKSVLDSQTLFGNGTKKTKSQKKWKRPAEELESTCQLKEDGSNYRPLLDTQTLLGNGMNRIKSQKKRKTLAEAVESTCQLKEDGSNYTPHLGSQTLFDNGTKKRKSQNKRKTPAEALQSTCQLKEDDSNFRPLLDAQTRSGNGKKKRKSRKKRRTPADEALESTCQLKEDGSNYQPLLNSQTLSGNGKKKRKSRKKRKKDTGALKSTCQLKEDGSNRPLLNSQTLSGDKQKRDTGALMSTCQLKRDGSIYRPLLNSQTLSGDGKKKRKSRKKRPAEALESTYQSINIEEGITKDPHTLTKVLSFPSKRYTERANAASIVYEATDSEAVGYSDSCANKQVTNRKHKKSKKNRNADVHKPDVCCGHLRIESTCNARTFGEENTDPKVACSVTKTKQSKVERERKLSRILLRMSFIKFFKLGNGFSHPKA